MTDILPPAGWLNVRQLETNEFATGGANGNMNEQAKSLAARSELLKKYAALPYESKTGGYALNERVQLATGDIVKSTVANNTNNPNIDMTGWVNVAAWSSIESKPTTVAGYGITDAYTKTEADTLFVEASQIGQPNGVAGLDALGKLDSSKFPLATETALGVAKIATAAIAQAGTNDTDIITAKKLLGFIKSNVIKNDFMDVTSSRVGGVTYTNPSSSSYLNIRINTTITGTGGRVSMFVNDKIEVKSSTSGGGAWGETIFLLVPPLGTYRLEGASALAYWGEA